MYVIWVHDAWIHICFIYLCAVYMMHKYIYVSYICVRLTYMCTSHIYVYVSYICVRLIYMCAVLRVCDAHVCCFACMWHEYMMHMRHISMCAYETHMYVCIMYAYLCVYVIWESDAYTMNTWCISYTHTYVYVISDAYIMNTWCIHVSYICIDASCIHDTRIWLIRSPKLHIIFHKRATKYRSLLRKMTYKKNA